MCDHQHCEKDSVATVEWQTGPTLELEYCSQHLQELRDNYPRSIKRVDLDA